MRLITDIKSGIKQIQNDLSTLKSSPMPFGWYYASNFVQMMPYQLADAFSSLFSERLTMGFSNVPGTKIPWELCGQKTLVHGFSMPVGKTVPWGWGVMSHADTISVLVAADKASVKDTDKLMEKFERNLDEFLGSKDWRKFVVVRN